MGGPGNAQRGGMGGVPGAAAAFARPALLAAAGAAGPHDGDCDCEACRGGPSDSVASAEAIQIVNY